MEIIRSLLFGSSISTLKHSIWLVFHIVKLTWHIIIIALLSHHFIMSGSGGTESMCIGGPAQLQHFVENLIRKQKGH